MRYAASLIVTGILMAAHATPASAQAKGPCFFLQPNFQGDPMCIAPTQRLPSLAPVVKNKLMSVQIPPGVRVTVCDGDNLGGSCQTLSESVANFTTIGAAGKVGSVASEAAAAPRAAAQQQAQAQLTTPPQSTLAPGPGAAQQPPSAPQSTLPPGPGAMPQTKAAAPQQPASPQSTLPPGPGAAPQTKAAAPQPTPPPGPGAAPQTQTKAPPPPNDEITRELRRQLVSLHRECENGDKSACVRMGFIIGENRGRRAQWRQDVPELFWWDK